MVTVKVYMRAVLLAALVTMSLGGFMLHLRVHPFSQHSSILVNIVASLLSILVVPVLFSIRRTVHYGYVLNGFITIVATITMGHFSIHYLPDPLSIGGIFLGTTLPDILIVWGKFFVGKALFDLEVMGYNADLEKRGVAWRYPNLGWWLVHLIAVSAVYWAGNVLWR